MKKKIALILTLTTFAASFAGCGSTASTGADDTQVQVNTTEKEKTTSKEASNEDVWELYGYTYEIPQYWNDLETSEGVMADTELAGKILAINEGNIDNISVEEVLSVILDMPKEDINKNNYEECYTKFMEKMGNPMYAGIDISYLGNDFKEDYSAERYFYNPTYFYQLDETKYLQVIFQQEADDELDGEYPGIGGFSIADKATTTELIENSIKVTKPNSSIYSRFFADEKGSY